MNKKMGKHRLRRNEGYETDADKLKKTGALSQLRPLGGGLTCRPRICGSLCSGCRIAVHFYDW